MTSPGARRRRRRASASSACRGGRLFRKILIANRGEIACRIARTCRRLGVAVAGVHSAADREALHVREIGETVEIGAGPAAESYLRIDAILEAARATGAQAIHPGFGFLAENADFARAVEAAGLAFIGPAPEALERLGDKAAAKREAAAAGVPVLPGSEAPCEDPAEIARLARRLGPPLMLKAAAGGGGKGMRVVTRLAGLRDEIESAMREAKNAFGAGGLIVEKLVEQGRHIEVQIAGDGAGRVLHLFERECSLQRRHQKIIEEAPAANLPDALRRRMLADAVRLGERLRYRGVGTVEFILQEDEYFFLEVNPRLQVEHPVTEAVTGVDIVELMLRVAAGEGLGLRQEDVRVRGHAVEARLYAEDPAAGFLPSTGRVAYVRFPADGVRVETGIESGMEITPYYDPMLAKLVAHAATRAEALDRLGAALDDTVVFGVATNQAFLKQLLVLEETRAASFHTRLIDERMASWSLERPACEPATLAVAACHWLMRQRGGEGPWRSWSSTGWQMAGEGEGLSPITALHLDSGSGSAEIRFAPLEPDGTQLVGVGSAKVRVGLRPIAGPRHLAVIDGRREAVALHMDDGTVHVRDRTGCHALRATPYLAYVGASRKASGELRAPMMGVILKVEVAAGDTVRAGDVLAVLESMKMEMRITAECDGTVEQLNCKPGQTVERNAVLALIRPEPAEGSGADAAASRPT